LVKGLLIFEHEVNGTPELVSQDREGLGFTMLMGKPLEILFPGLVTFEEKDRRLGENPLKMGVADLITVGSVYFTVGLFGAFDQAAVGDEILDRREALDGFDLVEND
jgi:hypothetical protein